MDSTDLLSAEEKTLLLALAHDAIAANLENTPAPSLAAFLKKNPALLEPAPPENSSLFLPLGVFVSLYNKGQLRGCIGSFRSETPLWKSVQHMAQLAATRDPRFAPIQTDERSVLKCEISVLSSPERIDGPEEVVVGRDGLIVESPTHRGVLLPQVATQYGWTPEKFLQQTCIKASLSPEAWQNKETKISNFQAIVFSDQESNEA